MVLYTLIMLTAATAISQDQIDGIKQIAGDNKFFSLSLNQEQIQHATNDAYESHEQRRLVSRHNTETAQTRRLAASASIDSSESPLFIGTGTHYANLYVGSPPQRVSVIVDTGSHHTAFPCSGCQSCGDHTDPYFSPSASSTSRKMTCAADCPKQKNFFRNTSPRTLGQCDATNDQCTFGQSYAEGSSWNAYQLKDQVWIGRHEEDENKAANLQVKETELQFGCINRQAGMFSSQISNGIMGFGRADSTLISALTKNNVVDHKVFSLCFAEDGGSVTFGAPDSDKRLHKAGKKPRFVPLLPSRANWYVVDVTGVRVGDVKMTGGTAAFNTGKGTIVDSGTTGTYLPRRVAEQFKTAFDSATGMEFAGGKQYTLSGAQVSALPAVYFDLNKGEDQGGVTVAMPASHYLDEVRPGTYRMRLYATESDGAILGANTMLDHDVIFDEENNRMGWVEADCHTPAVTATATAAPTPAAATAAAATAAAAAAATPIIAAAPGVFEIETIVAASPVSPSTGNSAEFVKVPVGAFYITIGVVLAVLIFAALIIGYLLGQRQARAGATTSKLSVSEEYGHVGHPTMINEV